MLDLANSIHWLDNNGKPCLPRDSLLSGDVSATKNHDFMHASEHVVLSLEWRGKEMIPFPSPRRSRIRSKSLLGVDDWPRETDIWELDMVVIAGTVFASLGGRTGSYKHLDPMLGTQGRQRWKERIAWLWSVPERHQRYNVLLQGRFNGKARLEFNANFFSDSWTTPSWGPRQSPL